MTLTRRTLTRTLAALAVPALVLAGCASTPSGHGEVVIGLTYTPDVQFAPFYVAEAKGYYEDSGAEVTLRHHGASESLFGALEAGEEHLVVAGGDEMLQARSAGVPVVSVGALYEDYPAALIVPEDSPIQGPQDLAGHSIGLPGPYGQTYFFLLVLLAEAGLTEAQAGVEYIGFTQQAALSAGHVDAVIGFTNNDVVQFEHAGTPVRTITPEQLPLAGSGIGAHEDVDAAALAAVLAATYRGVQDVIDDPEGAVAIAAEHVPGLAAPATQEAALATLEATIELYGGADGHQDPALWEQMAAFMGEQGLLEGEVDPAAAMTNEFLD